jgi:hypothetical protein
MKAVVEKERTFKAPVQPTKQEKLDQIRTGKRIKRTQSGSEKKKVIMSRKDLLITSKETEEKFEESEVKRRKRNYIMYESKLGTDKNVEITKVAKTLSRPKPQRVPTPRKDEKIVIQKKRHDYLDNYKYHETKIIKDKNPNKEVIVEHKRLGDIVGGFRETRTYRREVFNQGLPGATEREYKLTTTKYQRPALRESNSEKKMIRSSSRSSPRPRSPITESIKGTNIISRQRNPILKSNKSDIRIHKSTSRSRSVKPYSRGQIKKSNSRGKIERPLSRGKFKRPLSRGKFERPHSRGGIERPRSRGGIERPYSRGRIDLSRSRSRSRSVDKGSIKKFNINDTTTLEPRNKKYKSNIGTFSTLPNKYTFKNTFKNTFSNISITKPLKKSPLKKAYAPISRNTAKQSVKKSKDTKKGFSTVAKINSHWKFSNNHRKLKTDLTSGKLMPRKVSKRRGNTSFDSKRSKKASLRKSFHRSVSRQSHYSHRSQLSHHSDDGKFSLSGRKKRTSFEYLRKPKKLNQANKFTKTMHTLTAKNNPKNLNNTNNIGVKKHTEIKIEYESTTENIKTAPNKSLITQTKVIRTTHNNKLKDPKLSALRTKYRIKK